MFTAAEYYDMLIVYGACGESAYAAVEAYAARTLQMYFCVW
jgi:hypothetical protein